MVDCTSKNNSEILENHIINQILIEKWEKYGKKRFFEGFMFCVFQLALVCVIVYTRPDVIVVKEQFFPCQMSLEISEIQNRVRFFEQCSILNNFENFCKNEKLNYNLR